MSLPEGIRPWRTQRELPLDQVTAWEIDSWGATDENGNPLRRLRIKVDGKLEKAVARRRVWLCTLDVEGTPPPPPPPPPTPTRARRTKAAESSPMLDSTTRPVTHVAGAPRSARPRRTAAPTPTTTLRDYVEGGVFSRWMERELTDNTIYTRRRQFRGRLFPVLGDWTLQDCNTEAAQIAIRAHLDAARKRNGDPLTPNYKNQILLALGSVMTVAANAGLNDGVALLGYRLPIAEYRKDGIAKGQVVAYQDGYEWGKERYKRYTDDEMQRVFRACRDDWEYALAAFGFVCGCRISETCSRTYADIDWDHRELHIWNQVLPRTDTTPAQLGPPKNRITGYSPLTDQFLDVLKRLEAKATSPYILGSGDDLPFLTRVEVAHQWENIAKRAGLSKTNYHGTRHSYCSRLADLGFAPQEIQRLARHKKITTTFGYILPSREKLRRASDLLAIPE